MRSARAAILATLPLLLAASAHGSGALSSLPPCARVALPFAPALPASVRIETSCAEFRVDRDGRVSATRKPPHSPASAPVNELRQRCDEERAWTILAWRGSALLVGTTEGHLLVLDHATGATVDLTAFVRRLPGAHPDADGKVDLRVSWV